MLPFEFTVPGPPLSQQTRDRTKLKAWRELVRSSAAVRWGARIPIDQALRIVITYFHEGPAIRMDNDNMIKPIQDALNGLIYADDRQITDTAVRKTDIDGAFRIRGMSDVLVEAFRQGDEFLHIRIEIAPDHSGFLD